MCLLKQLYYLCESILPNSVCIARQMLWPDVCPSQAGISSKRVNGSTWFSMQRPSSTYPTLCYMVTQVPYSNNIFYIYSFLFATGFIIPVNKDYHKDTSFWNLDPNSELSLFMFLLFCHDMFIVASVVNFVRLSD